MTRLGHQIPNFTYPWYGLTLNAIANGHVPERLALLGDVGLAATA